MPMRPTLIGLFAAILVALVLITVLKLAGADEMPSPSQAIDSAGVTTTGIGQATVPNSASARQRFVPELAIKLLAGGA